MRKTISSVRSPFVLANRAEQGFTLTELLVVLGVFVALISLTVPDYLAQRPQRLLSAEANRMAAVIRQGRLYALRDNDKVYMEFLPEIDMYRLWSSSGWRAYADPINAPGEPPGRNPEIGDYDGDLDGDGDYWWGTGPLNSPTSPPEDPDVRQNAAGDWVYVDTDGVALDPDVLLMPTYPGNKPIRTVSPRLRIVTDPDTGEIVNITRDLGDTGGVAGDNVVPLEVDLRMEQMAWNPSRPLGKRNGILSHFPLLFIVFFPDGTLAASWDSVLSTGFGNEIVDLAPGALGAAQLHLQIRGEKYNIEAYNLFDPTIPVLGDEGPGEPLSQYDTLSLEESNSEVFGRQITVNNLTGRVIIRDFAPVTIDTAPVPYM